MNLSWLDRLSDWNPQLFRELKGRLKLRNVAIAAAMSLLGQLLLYMSLASQLPVPHPDGSPRYSSRYCTGLAEYGDYHLCIKDATGNILINWQFWWLDVFFWLSLIGIFALIVGGTYMLISDLEREDRRGTLNFIRLSPQPTQTILLGKILGVPILLYLAGILAIPLHLWSANAAQIPLGLIANFYGVLVASCICLYSAALLFGVVSTWLGGFQPWLASGALFILLRIASYKQIQPSPADWLNLLSPSIILRALISATVSEERFGDLVPHLEKLQWFYLPIGESVAGVVFLSLVSYGFWMYWIWQALLRRFPNPGATMLSKRQSYLLVAGAEILLLGFSVQSSSNIADSFCGLFAMNLLLFSGLIAALTPHRQALYDWARYRRDNVPVRKGFWRSSLVRDLMWSEKSPAQLAIAINLVSSTVILVPWMLLWEHALPSLILSMNFILIYAAIAQLMLFMKTQKQAIGAVSAVGAAALLPPIILGLLSIHPDKMPALWLFSAFPAFWSWEALEHASTTTVFMTILGQWLILVVLSLQLTRKLRRAGESASKALLAGRN